MITRRRQPSLSQEELSAILQAGADERVAFLSARSSTQAIVETLAAMANASGGVVLLGVTKGGTAQNVTDPRALRDNAVEAGLLTDPPLILPTPDMIEGGNGQIVVVQVPPGLPHLYSLRGRYLTRTASQNRPLTTPELRRLLVDRGEAGFDPDEDARVPQITKKPLSEIVDFL